MTRLCFINTSFTIVARSPFFARQFRARKNLRRLSTLKIRVKWRLRIWWHRPLVSYWCEASSASPDKRTKPMRSVKVRIGAGAASLLSSGAFAADMAIASPPPAYYPPPIEDFGGWYLRGDIGMTTTRGKFFAPAYDDVSTLSGNHVGPGFTGGTSYGLGVGYQFNSWFRADITGEYRSKVMFSGTDFASIDFGGGVGTPIGDTYRGGYKSWVGMVNLYADLGTWWCITPFVGVGFGGAYNQISGLSDITTLNLGGGTTSGLYQASAANKWDF